MHEWKLKRLINEMAARAIFEDVFRTETDSLVEQLKNRLKLPLNSTGYDVLIKLQSGSANAESHNASEDFNFERFLALHNLNNNQYVYINWAHLEETDKVDVHFLSQYFDDFWYPSSDDLDIIDQKLEWYISVNHDGFIKYFVFP